MEYVVEVVPLQAGEPVFEIREHGYAEACARARRYRERGWRGGGVHTVRERRTEMRRCAYLAVAALGAVAFLAAHDWATAWRGCEAVGGEFLLLLAPLWARMVEMLVTDWREGR